MLRASCMVAVAFVALSCSNAKRGELAIYDWEAQRASASDHGARDLDCRRDACPDFNAKTVYVLDAPKLTSSEVERETVRAGIEPSTGEPVVLVQFTAEGRKRFEELTRTLARRGALAKEPQHFLLVVDDVVYASPYIDYRRNPEGIPGDNGIQLIGLTTIREARELAKALRD